MSNTVLILVAVAGIFVLLYLVMKVKLHAFVALLLVSLLVGVAADMPLDQVLQSVQSGMGGTLGFVAVVVGLGAMFGQMLEVSGGAERLAQTLIQKFGEDKAQWALGLTGFMVAIPVFLDVGFIILVPIVYGLAEKTGRSLLYYGIPLLAGLAVTHAFVLLGTRRGYSREEVQNIATKALEPAGIIILVTGAGGVFKQVLIDSGVGQVLGDLMAASALPPLLLAFLIAGAVRVIQGSATVAMVTGAGLMVPIVQTLQLQGAVLGLIVLAIAAGATMLSHVNDSGFWLVNRYFGLSEKDTLRSWTVMTTLVSLIGFAGVFAIGLVIG